LKETGGRERRKETSGIQPRACQQRTTISPLRSTLQAYGRIARSPSLRMPTVNQAGCLVQVALLAGFAGECHVVDHSKCIGPKVPVQGVFGTSGLSVWWLTSRSGPTRASSARPCSAGRRPLQATRSSNRYAPALVVQIRARPPVLRYGRGGQRAEWQWRRRRRRRRWGPSRASPCAGPSVAHTRDQSRLELPPGARQSSKHP